MRTRLRPPGIVATLLSLLILTGCGGSPSDSARPEPSADSSPAPATSSSPTAMSEPSTDAATPSTDAPTTNSAEPTETKTGDAEKKVVITIRDFTYDGPRSVAPGARVTVKNEDEVIHTVTAEGKGSFDVSIEAGATETFTAPSEPGSYPYYCTFHANMNGTLRVG